MKLYLIGYCLAISIISISCRKPIYGCTDKDAKNYDPNATERGGATCNYEGSVVFYTLDEVGTEVEVTINGITNKITKVYNSVPSCGAAYCANFNLEPGNYAFSAKNFTLKWTGVITITKNGCIPFRLTL